MLYPPILVANEEEDPGSGPGMSNAGLVPFRSEKAISPLLKGRLRGVLGCKLNNEYRSTNDDLRRSRTTQSFKCSLDEIIVAIDTRVTPTQLCLR